jgi:DNA ligase-4
MPWLTEDLFSTHGITEFVLTPAEWKKTPPSSGTSTPTNRTPAPTQNRNGSSRRKRFALVESRRKGAVDALFQDMEAARLQRRNGKRDWIPVFDWKVIEELTTEEARHHCVPGKVEERFDSKSERSIWNKHWVGLA